MNEYDTTRVRRFGSLGGGRLGRTLLLSVLLLVVIAISGGVPLSGQTPPPLICGNDVDGANDEVGQGDLTRFCSGDVANNQQDGEINWDKIIWTGEGQTGDACWLFNTDGDAGVNYAFCVSVEKDEPSGVRLAGTYSWSCDDRENKPVNE